MLSEKEATCFHSVTVLVRILYKWYHKWSEEIWIWHLHRASFCKGCILYADDIVLSSASCTGLQHMVNICAQYGRIWDISFNPAKSQYITFGDGEPRTSRISLNNTELHCTEKLKYLGCYFHQRSCRIDLNSGVCKFCAKVNNILSVIGYNRNELATLHLVKTYCVPTVLYGCETWQLDCNDHRRCCWRESVSCLLFYCQTIYQLQCTCY